jgi:hypothetical protein
MPSDLPPTDAWAQSAKWLTWSQNCPDIHGVKTFCHTGNFFVP